LDDSQGNMYESVYDNATRFVISPESGSVTKVSGVSHYTKNWAGVGKTLDTDNIKSSRSPCFPVVISMECK